MPVDERQLRRRLQTEYALLANDPNDGEHGRERALRWADRRDFGRAEMKGASACGR